MSKPPKPLSDAARAVLRALLTARADCPDRALTDKQLALAARVSRRLVIELRQELVDYGYLVVATCGTPPGSFIDPPNGPLTESTRYKMSRRMRLREQAKSLRSFCRALESAELSRRPAASDGQLNLPIPLATDPRRFTA